MADAVLVVGGEFRHGLVHVRQEEMRIVAEAAAAARGVDDAAFDSRNEKLPNTPENNWVWSPQGVIDIGGRSIGGMCGSNVRKIPYSRNDARHPRDLGYRLKQALQRDSSPIDAQGNGADSLTSCEHAEGPDPGDASTGNSDQLTTADQSRRRWSGLVKLLLFVCISAWLSRFVYLRLTFKPTPRSEYWQAKIERLDPPGNNAADTEAVYKLLNQSVWHHTREQDMPGPLTSTWSKPGNIEWRKGVPRAKPFTRPEYAQLRSRVRTALNAGWSEPLWTHLSGSVSGVDCFANAHEHWCEILLLHSRASRERGEGMDTCLENWRMVISLARQIIRPRLSYNQYTASEYIRSTAQEMIFTAREPHDQIDVHRLADEIHAILGEPMEPSDLLEGERLLLHMLLESVYVRQGGDWLVVSEVRSVFNFRFDLCEVPAPQVWNLTSPFFNDLNTARRRVDEYIKSLNALTCLADFATYGPKNAEDFRPLRPSSIDGLPLYGGGTLEFTVRDYYVALGELEAALTMLALSEYYRANDCYPKKIDDLVPHYLPRVPIDYADLEPLRYRREGADYVLYSVGYNGVDDGGEGEPKFNRFKPDLDVVFTQCKRPER